jgi:hypothetical protein
MLSTLLAQAQQANLTDIDSGLLSVGGSTGGALGVVSIAVAWVRSVVAGLREESQKAATRIRDDQEKINARLDILTERVAALDKQQGVDAVRVEGVADAIGALRQEISRSVFGR